MEFGSLGLTPQPQQTPAAPTAPAGTATIQANPENVVSEPARSEPAQDDQRRDTLGRQADEAVQRRDDGSLAATNRRTTLNFDTEQNRVFLEVIDTNTDKVVERIPSENFIAFITAALEDARPAEAPDGVTSVDQSV